MFVDGNDLQESTNDDRVMSIYFKSNPVAELLTLCYTRKVKSAHGIYPQHVGRVTHTIENDWHRSNGDKKTSKGDEVELHVGLWKA